LVPRDPNEEPASVLLPRRKRRFHNDHHHARAGPSEAAGDRPATSTG
jgi:hypothetical protein